MKIKTTMKIKYFMLIALSLVISACGGGGSGGGGSNNISLSIEIPSVSANSAQNNSYRNMAAANISSRNYHSQETSQNDTLPSEVTSIKILVLDSSGSETLQSVEAFGKSSISVSVSSGNNYIIRGEIYIGENKDELLFSAQSAIDTSGAIETISVNLELEVPDTISLTLADTWEDQEINAGDAPKTATATLSGLSDNNVNWYVNHVQGGNTAIGTIIQGVYTPPNRLDVTTNNQTITISAKASSTTYIAESFSFNLLRANQVPVLTNPVSTQTVSGNVNISIPTDTFTDADAGDILTYSASGLPLGLTFNTATNTITGTKDDFLTYTITLKATDMFGAYATTTFDIASPEKNALVSFIEPNGTPLNEDHDLVAKAHLIKISVLDSSGLEIDRYITENTGYDISLPSGANYTVRGEVYVGENKDELLFFGESVVDTNVISNEQISVDLNLEIPNTINLTFTDTWEGQDISAGSTPRTATATLSGFNDDSVNWYVNNVQGGNATLGTIDQGIYTPPESININSKNVTIAIRAKSAIAPYIAEYFNFNLLRTNQAPVVKYPLSTQIAFGNVNINIPTDTFTDSDAGDTLTYSASGLPSGLTFNTATNTITGTKDDFLTYTITLKATDMFGAYATTTFNIASPQILDNTAVDVFFGESFELPMQLSYNTATGVFNGSTYNTQGYIQIKGKSTDTAHIDIESSLLKIHNIFPSGIASLTYDFDIGTTAGTQLFYVQVKVEAKSRDATTAPTKIHNGLYWSAWSSAYTDATSITNPDKTVMEDMMDRSRTLDANNNDVYDDENIAFNTLLNSTPGTNTTSNTTGFILRIPPIAAYGTTKSFVTTRTNTVYLAFDVLATSTAGIAIYDSAYLFNYPAYSFDGTDGIIHTGTASIEMTDPAYLSWTALEYNAGDHAAASDSEDAQVETLLSIGGEKAANSWKILLAASEAELDTAVDNIVKTLSYRFNYYGNINATTEAHKTYWKSASNNSLTATDTVDLDGIDLDFEEHSSDMNAEKYQKFTYFILKLREKLPADKKITLTMYSTGAEIPEDSSTYSFYDYDTGSRSGFSGLSLPLITNAEVVDAVEVINLMMYDAGVDYLANESFNGLNYQTGIANYIRNVPQQKLVFGNSISRQWAPTIQNQTPLGGFVERADRRNTKLDYLKTTYPNLGGIFLWGIGTESFLINNSENVIFDGIDNEGEEPTYLNTYDYGDMTWFLNYINDAYGEREPDPNK